MQHACMHRAPVPCTCLPPRTWMATHDDDDAEQAGRHQARTRPVDRALGYVRAHAYTWQLARTRGTARQTTAERAGARRRSGGGRDGGVRCEEAERERETERPRLLDRLGCSCYTVATYAIDDGTASRGLDICSHPQFGQIWGHLIYLCMHTTHDAGMQMAGQRAPTIRHLYIGALLWRHAHKASSGGPSPIHAWPDIHFFDWPRNKDTCCLVQEQDRDDP